MKPGILLVINNARNRIGSDTDAANLKETFEKMNAHVIIKKDPTAENTREIMDEFKKTDFTPYSYVAVAFLAHGGEDSYALTADEQLIHIQKTILFPLCRKEELDGKLKWLIMQTCRGSFDFLTQVSEGPAVRFFPRYYVKFFATTEGTRAFRAPFQNAEGDIVHESFFIKALCKRLANEYKTRDIISIMNDVRNDVVRAGISQTPAIEENLNGIQFRITQGLIPA